jgi:histidyl-tRNA synthetase
MESNPLRVLDCKVASCQEATQDAPRIAGHLCEECREHFETVKADLDAYGVPYVVNERIVRGLDYYIRTTFELLATTSLGAQNAICGGGRYDGLVEELGGPRGTPGIGFAIGLDRLILVREDQRGHVAPPAVYVVVQDRTLMDEARKITMALRKSSVRTEMDYEPASMKAQMRRADRRGAQFVVIVGAEEFEAGEVTLRAMQKGTQTRVPIADLADHVPRWWSFSGTE